MSTLVRADPILGRHLFVADPHAPTERWARADGLDSAVLDAFAAIDPWIQTEERLVSVGTLDELGQASEDDVITLAAGAPWPTGVITAVTAAASSIRIGVPQGAHLGATTQFACESGFLRTASVREARPHGELATAWIDGSRKMEVHLRAHVDGRAYFELQLGPSLFGGQDLRDPSHAVEGAPLAEWHAAARSVAAAIAARLASVGFSRA